MISTTNLIAEEFAQEDSESKELQDEIDAFLESVDEIFRLFIRMCGIENRLKAA